MYYTGIGSRQTPISILKLITNLAVVLRLSGYTLRSGGAVGADTAFENGARSEKQIFYAKDATHDAMQIAMHHHPAWHRCGDYARKLHARNAFQILGVDLKTPSTFVVCWTPDGAYTDSMRSIKTGGTGTAISIATTYNIPVYNLKHTPHYARIIEFLTK